MVRIKKNNNVSIVTITQYKRFESLKILFLMIQNQTYKNINEWIIVEGSQNENIATKNKNKITNFINDIKKNITFLIKYIDYSGKKLGGLRNLGNSRCTSPIIVCFDDDDYYPPERIESAVITLNKSNCLIAGVSDVYLYDFFLDKLFKFNGFMDYHSTNNCMAYKKEFLLLHKYDDNVEVGEERSFTCEFTTPLVKLNSRKCIIAISHNGNTFNKRELCLGGVLNTLHTLKEIKEPITNYIEPIIFNQMKELYIIEEYSSYDIVYIIGGFTNKFNPCSNILYDNERFIIELVQYWKKRNKKIAVYGEFETFNTINGIDYIDWKNFPFNHIFNIIILYRTNGFLTIAPFPIKAKIICWDVYDNFINDTKLIEFWNLYGYKINKIFLKSNFHKSEFIKYLNYNSNQEIIIIPSGLRIDKFINKENIIRNPYRFCYTTYYDRGLEFIITGIFSVIKKIEPRAELHIYTGMEYISDTNFKNKMTSLFSELGVCDHGAQPIEIIVREKYMSSFELYISNIINEVDCISIRESILAGCIPLIANFGIFLERDGFKFNMNHENTHIMQQNALLILNLIKDNIKINNARLDFMKNCTTLLSWSQVGDLIYSSLYKLN